MTLQWDGNSEKAYWNGLVDRVYYNGLAYRLPPIPTISSFTANPTHFRSEDLPTTNTLLLTFAVSDSTRNRIHAGNTNVPLTSGTTARTAIPSTDTRYVLTSTNSHGDATATLDFVVTTDVSVTLTRSGTVRQQAVPLSNLINQYQDLIFGASGHPFPNLSITNFQRINLNLDYSRGQTTITAFRQISPGDPAADVTYTLTGFNGYTSSITSVTIHYPGYPT